MNAGFVNDAPRWDKPLLDHPLVYICSPYKGDVATNTQNARRYCRFCFDRGGIPFAPHLLYTQFLDDDLPTDRVLGMSMGLEMLRLCDELWAFDSPSEGLAIEMDSAARAGKPIRRFDSLCRELTEPMEVTNDE
jgi:hypothetical protein